MDLFKNKILLSQYKEGTEYSVPFKFNWLKAKRHFNKTDMEAAKEALYFSSDHNENSATGGTSNTSHIFIICSNNVFVATTTYT